MSVKSEEALALFKDGCNCCQAILASAGDAEGLGREDALRLGSAFGGGMRRGEVCGAVTGALMLLGLRHGARDASEQDRKADANARTIAYMKAFQERYGSYLCRDLIKNAGKKVCETVIPGAIELLDELEKK